MIMKLDDTEFEMLLHLIRTMEEKELKNESIMTVISSVIKDFEPRMTEEQKKELMKQFPHFFSSGKRFATKEIPMYDYF